MHIITLPQSEHDLVDYQAVPAIGSDDQAVPLPRVGHTIAAVDERLYLFGGRGGKDMKPLEENGRVWVFDTKLNQWSYLDPAKGSPYPAARSYHSSASTAHPLSFSTNDQTENAMGAAQSGFDDHGTVFVHAGCPATGRTADVWGFDIASRVWSQYADAPGAPRGGPSLTFAQDRLYRFGGFDGERELGGSIDFLHFTLSTFDDKGGKGELAVFPKTGSWESVAIDDGTDPGKRSVAGFQPITTGQGRNYLLLFLGEKDPSSSGHDAAGKFWDDVYSFQLKPDGMTGASFKDATRMLVGAGISENTWARVDIPESSKMSGEAEGPGARGWFASTQGQDLGPETVVLWGGVLNDNSRATDGWILTVTS